MTLPKSAFNIGAAAVIGGSENVSYGIMKIKDQAIPVSPKRDI